MRLSIRFITIIYLSASSLLACIATPPIRNSITLFLGGQGDPRVIAVKDGAVCKANIPDVPQPYGDPGR